MKSSKPQMDQNIDEPIGVGDTSSEEDISNDETTDVNKNGKDNVMPCSSKNSTSRKRKRRQHSTESVEPDVEPAAMSTNGTTSKTIDHVPIDNGCRLNGKNDSRKRTMSIHSAANTESVAMAEASIQSSPKRKKQRMLDAVKSDDLLRNISRRRSKKRSPIEISHSDTMSLQIVRLTLTDRNSTACQDSQTDTESESSTNNDSAACIEKICKMRMRKGQYEYLVKSAIDDTCDWMPKTDLDEQMIIAFYEKSIQFE